MRPAFLEPVMASPLSSVAELTVDVGVTEDPGRDTGPSSFEGGLSFDNGEDDFGFLKPVVTGDEDGKIAVRRCVEREKSWSDSDAHTDCRSESKINLFSL